jgi:hypothetical protein
MCRVNSDPSAEALLKLSEPYYDYVALQGYARSWDGGDEMAKGLQGPTFSCKPNSSSDCAMPLHDDFTSPVSQSDQGEHLLYRQ